MNETIYVGTQNGVVVASRSGTSFEVAGEYLAPWAVTSFAHDKENANIVFAGTRGDGVWVTEDFGKRWTKPCYGKVGPGKVQSLNVHNGQILAGCEPIAVFASKDNGASWEEISSVREFPWVKDVTYPVPTVEPHVRDVACFGDAQMYVALQVGYMLKSTDSGKSWKLLNDTLDSDVHSISIDPKNPGKIVIATGGHDSRGGSSQGKALFRTETGGDAWKPVAMGFEQEYGLPLARHSKNTDVLVAGLAKGYEQLWARPGGAESALLRSEDGGSNWSEVDLGELSSGSRQMVVDLSTNENDPDRLFGVMSDGKVIESGDFGNTWNDTGIQAPRGRSIEYVVG